MLQQLVELLNGFGQETELNSDGGEFRDVLVMTKPLQEAQRIQKVEE